MKKLTQAETEVLLEHLCDRQNCYGGCDCVFCRTFERGVEYGKECILHELSQLIKKETK